MIQVNRREYHSPDFPVVVVCLDGSSTDYLEAAVTTGMAPFVGSLLAANQYPLCPCGDADVHEPQQRIAGDRSSAIRTWDLRQFLPRP